MDFEAQWKHPTSLLLGKQQVDVYDIKPNEQQGLPVLIVLGWGAVPAICKELIRGLVQQGRRVICVNSPHGIDHTLTIPVEVGPVADTERRRIASFMQALAILQIEHADAVGNSQGAVDLLVAATLYPDQFQTIILIAPEGLSGGESLVLLACRYFWETVKGYASAYQAGHLRSFVHYINTMSLVILAHPVRSFAEAYAVASADVAHLLVGIKQRGTRLALIYNEHDTVVQPQKLINISLFEKVRVLPGGHPDILINTNRYVEAIKEVLES